MAIRNVRKLGDETLETVCRPVKKMTDHLNELIDDMFDTMYDANGVGLAAPQVGVLRRIVVIDVTGEDPYVLINPEIIETEGEQENYEGCLSVPGKMGIVKRPARVKAKALDRNMEEFTLEGEALLARAICHELDHLDGVMYTTKVEGDLEDVNPPADDDEEDED
jgi:peptide deformylase